MKCLSLIFVILSLLFSPNCALKTQPAAALATVNQTPDVSPLIPDDLSFAKDFVQALQDAGAVIQKVQPSKFNGFFRDTKKAAFIRTDKGIIEGVFFETEDDVRQILVTDNSDRNSSYHRYLVQKPPLTTQRIEGNACYFAKYRNVFIITSDNQTNDFLKRLPQ